MKQSGVHLSVRPSVSYQRRAAGMLLSAVRAEDVDIQRRAAGAQQQRHLSRGRSTALSSKCEQCHR